MAIAADRVRLVFKRTKLDLSNLAASITPESVHRFRTNTRRLQTLLEELAPERNRNQKKLLKLLDGIRKRAGKVRNVDAQLSALRSLKIPQEPRRKTQLMQALLELRAKHERRLRKALKNEIVPEIDRHLKKAAKEATFQNDRDPLAVARKLLTLAVKPIETSVGIRKATTKKVTKFATKAEAATEATLHDRRIVIKRARYVAEFAPKSAEATELIAQLQALQDTIGNWHDWQALTSSAAKHFGGVGHSSLVAALHSVAAGKLRGASAALVASSAKRMPEAKMPTLVIPADSAA
jgi:CHAD domain-containing protein